MRPGQNKRMRGRNRRGPNPLTRSYESNGPDVKVRGTAQHVAEKYVQLARDAHVAGDPVAAEGYLQHAEHYYRLIAAAQQVQQAAQGLGGEERDDLDEEDFETGSDRFAFRSPAQSPTQPFMGGELAEGSEGEGDERPPERMHDRPPQGDRQAPRRHERNDRNDRNFRPRSEIGGDRNNERHNERNFGQNRNRPPRPLPSPEALPGGEQPSLPAFLTAPVRQIPIVTPGAPEAFTPGDEAAPGPFRQRRRRRPRAEGEEFEPELPVVTPSE